mgnify:CR=1 FL=1|jgi:hypothetical protein
MIFLTKVSIVLESIASLKISMLNDCYLVTLLSGTYPIKNGSKLYFASWLLDDFVKKFTKPVFFFGILKISKGRLSPGLMGEFKKGSSSESLYTFSLYIYFFMGILFV